MNLNEKEKTKVTIPIINSNQYEILRPIKIKIWEGRLERKNEFMCRLWTLEWVSFKTTYLRNFSGRVQVKAFFRKRIYFPFKSTHFGQQKLLHSGRPLFVQVKANPLHAQNNFLWIGIQLFPTLLRIVCQKLNGIAIFLVLLMTNRRRHALWCHKKWW